MVEPRPENDSAGTAPGSLRWIEEFINTRRADRDELATPEQLVAWLTARDLLSDPGTGPVSGTVAASPQHRDRAERLREGLRALIAGNNAEPVASPRPDGLDPAAQSELAALAPQLPLVLDTRAQPPRLVPGAGDPVDAALTWLLAYASEAVAAGTWSRLKACREPSCRWAYYDHSRNRRRTWCSMDLCGNRAKARSFHQRSST